MSNVALKATSFATFSCYITTDNNVVDIETCEMKLVATFIYWFEIL
jgi:hypothetical protein